jgi:hypothetical protein
MASSDSEHGSPCLHLRRGWCALRPSRGDSLHDWARLAIPCKVSVPYTRLG